MKHFYYGLIVLWLMAAAAPLTARAAEMKFGGEFRARGFYTNNLTDLNSGKDDQEAFNDARFRLKVSATEGVATGVVRVDFFNGPGGEDVAALNSASPGDGTGDRTLGSEGFGRSLDTVRLKEGYLRVSWPQFHLVVGRQSVTLGHGLILDDTADAVSVAIPMGWSTLTVVDLLIDTPARGSGSSSAYLANLNLSPTADFGSSLFALLLKDRGPNLSFGQSYFFTPCGIGSGPVCPILTNFGDDQATLAVVGWAMDHHGPSFRWATELNYLKGSIRTNQAVAMNPFARGIDLRGGNALGQFGWTGRRLDVLLTGLYATGQTADDLPPAGHRLNINAISPNFVLGNILANNETVSDRDGGNIGGLSAAKLAVGWRFGGMIRGELAGIGARMTEEPATDAPQNLGWELDANASWQLDPHLLLTGGFGILFPGDAWMILMDDTEAVDHMIKASTKLIYTF
ncbi:MAG TPA: hypothetical protein VIL61_02040 [Nitrospiria bacterium]